jgi:hypothetical protein
MVGLLIQFGWVVGLFYLIIMTSGLY